MVPDYTKIRRTFRHALEAIDGLPVKAWQNRNFTPPDPQAQWIRETLIPADDKPITTDQVESAGIMIFDVFDAAGTGTEAIEATAKLVASAFPLGAISYNGTNVAIDRVSQKGPRPSGQWCQIAVQIQWRSYTYH